MSRKTGRFTYLLRWNPDISSITMEEWKYWMDHFRFIETNWSVHDWEESDYGDAFFMLKVGSGRQGIVMRGWFTSLPYLSDSWRNDGSRIFYRDLRIDNILDPENGPIIPIEDLKAAMPDVDWEHGHSGVFLTVEQQLMLNELWAKFEAEHPEIIVHQNQMINFYIEPSAAKKVIGFEKFRKAMMWSDDKEYPLTEDCMHDCVNLAFTEDYDKRLFNIKVWFNGGKEVNFVCHDPRSIKMNLLADDECSNEFMIYEHGPNYLHLKANGVDVICSNIEVRSVRDSKLEWLHVSI